MGKNKVIKDKLARKIEDFWAALQAVEDEIAFAVAQADKSQWPHFLKKHLKRHHTVPVNISDPANRKVRVAAATIRDIIMAHAEVALHGDD